MFNRKSIWCEGAVPIKVDLEAIVQSDRFKKDREIVRKQLKAEVNRRLT